MSVRCTTVQGRSPSRFPRGERPRHNGTVRVRQTGESDGRTFSCGRFTIHRQSVNIYLHTFLAHFSDTIVLPPPSRMWRKGPVTWFYIFMIGGQLRYSIVRESSSLFFTSLVLMTIIWNNWVVLLGGFLRGSQY